MAFLNRHSLGKISLLLILPAAAYAAPIKPKLPPHVLQSAKLIESLAISARPHVIEANNTLADLTTRESKLAALQKNMESELAEAKTAHGNNESALKKANSDLYALETKGVTLPSVAGLHGRLLEQIPYFISQAVDPFAPEHIVGDIFLNTRPTMAKVIAAEKSYVIQAGTTAMSAKDFISTVKTELQSIAANPGDRRIIFGAEHYLRHLLLRFEGVRAGITNASTFFQGLSVDGEILPLTSDCFVTETFSDHLAAIRDYAATLPYKSSNPNEQTFPKAMKDLVMEYDGAGSVPGLLDTWQACVTNTQRDIDLITSEITREVLNGNLDLAADLDDQRIALTQKKLTYLAELSVMQERRGQLNLISGAASAAAAQGNEANYHLGVFAAVDNLEFIATVFPSVLATSLDLLARARSEIEALQEISDPVELSNRMILAAARLDAIRNYGYLNIDQQFTSAENALGTMSGSISSGAAPLTNTIDTYRTFTATKFNFWDGQLAALPEALSKAEDDLSAKQTAYDNSLAFLKDLKPRFDEFTARRAYCKAALAEIKKKVSSAKFNPIYTGLMTLALDQVQPDPNSRKAIEAEARRYLRSFNGIAQSRVASPYSVRRFSNPIAAALRIQVNLLKADIRQAINDVSMTLMAKPLFDSIDELIAEIADLEAY